MQAVHLFEEIASRHKALSNTKAGRVQLVLEELNSVSVARGKRRRPP